MRIGLLVPSVGSFGAKGFYNLQEVGLGKALAEAAEKVRVWRLVSKDTPYSKEKIGKGDATVEFLPCAKIGVNGMVPYEKLDTELDVLVCFSDNQLSVPGIWKWAKKHGILFIPYVGVSESHSLNSVKRKLMDLLFRRNIKVYKKCRTLVKTPAVKEKLETFGLSRISVMPVGLDATLLNHSFPETDAEGLKEKYGFKNKDRIVLFIGRLTEEKRPLELPGIFKNLLEKDERVRLLIVGKGELEEELLRTIHDLEIKEYVKHIRALPNRDIWELYRIAETFVNLNQQEIFGMAILEAMYYGVKVVAYHAPGPDFIIENGVSGYLVRSEEELLEYVLSEKDVSQVAHKRIKENFTWDSMAKELLRIIEEEKKNETGSKNA